MSATASTLAHAGGMRPSAPAPRRRGALARWAPLLVLIALLIGFTLANPRFMTQGNLARIAIAAGPTLLVALGATFVILLGSIDLSMEGTVACTAVVFALCFQHLGGSLAGWGLLAVPAALATGVLLGAVNGLLHVRLRIPSFMASLALGFVGMGLAVVLTDGEVTRVEGEFFRALIFERIAGFPLMVYVVLAFVLLAWFILAHTALGRNFYALGGGEDLAHASGLDTQRVRVMAFALAGLFFALAALLAVARAGMAEALTGANYMFISVTAVVVGGTSLMGGVGGVWNTVVGVLIVYVIQNGMAVTGMPRYTQHGVLGVLVIAAVVLARRRGGHQLVK